MLLTDLTPMLLTPMLFRLNPYVTQPPGEAPKPLSIWFLSSIYQMGPKNRMLDAFGAWLGLTGAGRAPTPADPWVRPQER